jgi:hypothetical protein
MAPHPLLPPLPTPQASSSGSTTTAYKPSAFFIHAPNEPVFQSHPALSTAAKVTVISAGVGLLVSSVQNALDKHDRGAMGIFTRTGGTISFFGQSRSLLWRSGSFRRDRLMTDVIYQLGWDSPTLSVKPWLLTCERCVNAAQSKRCLVFS